MIINKEKFIIIIDDILPISNSGEIIISINENSCKK